MRKKPIKIEVDLVQASRARVIRKLEAARALEHARVLKMAAAILRYHEAPEAKGVEELALDLQEGSK